jgi:GTP-binding protein
MKFVDYVTITVRSGKGGPGALSFRRAKYEPKGGPDGGDGGRGASVILEGDEQLYTLLDLRYNRHHYAPNGERGGKNHRSGKDGEDIVLRVPVGTVAKDAETDEVIAEVNEAGERVVLVEGGRGGKGNSFFKSSTNQTPMHHQPGEPGEEREVVIELKLLADVGLVGFPNAGKSTLISSISAAKPKVADYPFTTLEPNLGIAQLSPDRRIVFADIPGIIEGAHEGRGLGLRFLKHIERNAVLLFVIPVTSEDIAEEFETLMNELRAFNADLVEKPLLVALSKIDVLPPEEREGLAEEHAGAFPEGTPVLPISSVSGLGLDALKRALWTSIQRERALLEGVERSPFDAE